jgi:hypothetical protein
LSSTSDIPPVVSATSQLSEGEDHVRVVVVVEVLAVGCAVQVCEVAVGARGLEAIAGLGALFPGMLHSLGGLLDSHLPDTNLVFAVAVADNVRTDPPIVVLEGCQ